MASMTKPIVGVALMLLQEEGRWQLDDPLDRHLPEFATTRVLAPDGELIQPSRPMTVRHLITSTAGISGFGTVVGAPANGRGVEVQRRYAAAELLSGDVRDLAVAVADLPLASHPGERFQYGLSHDVQGALIEVLAGTTLDRFLGERIFEPLGMRDTGFLVASSERERLVELAEYGADGGLVASDRPAARLRRRTTRRATALVVGGGRPVRDPRRLQPPAADARRPRFARRRLPPVAVVRRRDDRDLLPDGVHVEFQQPWVGHGYGVNVRIVEDPVPATMWSGPVGPGTWYWSGAHGSWFWVDPVNDLIVVGFVQHAFSGMAHMGRPHAAPDVRALSRALSTRPSSTQSGDPTGDARSDVRGA